MLFVGHTHMPCVITDKYETKTSAELNNKYSFPDLCEHKVIINVGSVGQPRDRDNRACYVIVDGTTISWRRLEYEFEKTAALTVRTVFSGSPQDGRRYVQHEMAARGDEIWDLVQQGASIFVCGNANTMGFFKSQVRSRSANCAPASSRSLNIPHISRGSAAGLYASSINASWIAHSDNSKFQRCCTTPNP